MLRRAGALVLVGALLACSPNQSCPRLTCRTGVVFVFDALTAGLVGGVSVPVRACVDRTCKNVTIAGGDTGGRPFVELGRLDDGVAHIVTVEATTGFALRGQYTGPLEARVDDTNGTACPGACRMATVNIAPDGTITAATIAGAVATAAGAAATTSTTGAG